MKLEIKRATSAKLNATAYVKNGDDTTLYLDAFPDRTVAIFSDGHSEVYSGSPQSIGATTPVRIKEIIVEEIEWTRSE